MNSISIKTVYTIKPALERKICKSYVNRCMDELLLLLLLLLLLCYSDFAADLLFQLAHDLLLQSGNIGLGDTEEGGHLLLGHFLSVPCAQPEPQPDNGPLPVRQLIDGTH